MRLTAFDAVEPNNVDSNRQNYGNNRYKYSNILQWMNSDKAGGEWYTIQHKYDQAPTSNYVTSNPYNDIDGLLRRFSSVIVNQMKEVSKKTLINITDVNGSAYENIISKISLLSRTEVGLGNENSIEEGSVYEYFSNNNTNAQRIAYPSTYTLNNSDSSDTITSNKALNWWLRTPNYIICASVREVYYSGSLSTSSACYGSRGLRFVFVLKSE